MIWFACSTCGRKHGRPESSIGSLIFCDCGQGNTVPWDSTVEPPTEIPEPPVAAPAPPRMEPVPVGEEHIPVVRPAPRSRSRRAEARDPNFCFNHSHLPSEQICEECQERFCENCIVAFNNKTMCGPCKNVRLRKDSRPARPSVLAVFAIIGGLTFGPAGFCVMPFGTASAELLPLMLVTVLLQLGILGLGVLALYKMGQDPLLTGKSLAVTGVLCAGLGIMVVGAVTAHSYLHWV